MYLILSALVSSLVLCALIGAMGLGLDMTKVFIVCYIASFILGLPFAIIRGFSNGLVDRAQDREDAREERVARRQRRSKSVTYVDARTAIVDSRSITVTGRSRPKENYNGKD